MATPGYDFAAALCLRVAAFSKADEDQSAGQQKRGGATAGFGPLMHDGQVIVKQLHALMNNLYKGNAVKLGEWTTASHVAHAAPAKAKTAAPAKTVP